MEPAEELVEIEPTVDSIIDDVSTEKLACGEGPALKTDESILNEILGHKLGGLNFLVGSCDDLSTLKGDLILHESQNESQNLKFIFVDDTLEEEDVAKEQK